MLKTAIFAAKEAEKIVMNYFGKKNEINYKGEVNLVTKVDLLSEKKIVEIIKNKFPDHGFILEEGDDFSINNEYVWAIDPIDGTTSFAHNYPMFSISIALFKNKKLILGVVNIPYLKELFYAQKGKGAFLNNKKIEISNISSLNKSLIATGFPYTRISSNIDNIKYLKKMIKIVQGIRRSGSAAIDICYVACGRLDGYWELGLKKMDTAAAQIILNEAGGKVTDFVGNSIDENFSKIIASNSLIHNEIIKVLRGD